MTENRTRNARGSGSELRGDILSAALALADSGDVLTLRGIARQANVTAPAIYAHFEGLSSVVDAVLAQSFEELRSRVTVPGLDPAHTLFAAVEGYLGFAREHPARFRLMFSAGGYSPDAVSTFRAVEDAISACVRSGLSSSTDPHADAFMVWVAVHGMATLEKPARDDLLRLGPIDRPQVVHEMVRRLARLT